MIVFKCKEGMPTTKMIEEEKKPKTSASGHNITGLVLEELMFQCAGQQGATELERSGRGNPVWSKEQLGTRRKEPDSRNRPEVFMQMVIV